MLRVLILSTDLERGGLPLRLTRLAPRLPEHDVEPIVGCLARPGPLQPVLEKAGVATFACGARSALDMTALARLAAFIRTYDPDVVHSSLFHANIAARLVGRLDRPRPVVTSTVTIEIERGWHRWLESLTGGLSDLHIANSNAVAEHARVDLGFPPDRVVVLPNGVDLPVIAEVSPIDRRARGLRDDLPLIAWAGRMDPVKDLPTWVAVVEDVQRRLPVQAVLLGDGPARAAIERRVELSGLARVMVVAPWSEQVPAWLKAADVLLFPSRTEGSPNVVIEAMLCGCPVVASDVPALRDLIEPGRRGLLCPPGDVRAFSAAVRRILADPALADRLSAAALEAASTGHDLRRSVASLARVYHALKAAQGGV